MSEEQASGSPPAKEADRPLGPDTAAAAREPSAGRDERDSPAVMPSEPGQAEPPQKQGVAVTATPAPGAVVALTQRPGQPPAPRPRTPATAASGRGPGQRAAVPGEAPAAVPTGGAVEATAPLKRPAEVVVATQRQGQAAAPVVPRPRPVPTRPQPAPIGVHPRFVEQFELLSTMRQTRRRRFLVKFALFVGVPTLLAFVYVFAWATPRYESEFEITYQSFQAPQTLSSGLVQTLFGGAGAGVDLGSIIYEYIRSATLLSQLDAKLNLRQYYSSSKIDYPMRLRRDASDEAFLRYYRLHMVSVSEGLGGYLTVTVQAFDPNFATALAQAIVQATDKMVDDMTARARQDEVRFAESELKRQEERVIEARTALTRFENVHGDLNPQEVANQLGQIAGGLESALAQARSQLATLLTQVRPDAPQVVSLKSQIAALEKQLQSERSRLANASDKTAYSAIIEQFSRLQLEQEFAKDAYLAAQQGLAVARADAARKENYLVDFVAPSRRNQPTSWFPVTYVATAFIGSLSLYAVGSLIAGAFRDQAGL
jgi:capsular polysaccharide transport system permease protein